MDMLGNTKKYPHGKYRLYATGADPRYEKAAAEAFFKASEVYVRFDEAVFWGLMRESGVPDEEIKRYRNSMVISDDLWSDERTEHEL